MSRTLASVASPNGIVFVCSTHSKKEYGKDFTFSEITLFGGYRHYGLQAKAGDIR